MAIKLPRSVFFEALRHHDKASTAIIDSASGESINFASLLQDISRFKHQLLQELDKVDISGERVVFIVENSYNYVGQ